MKRLHNMDVKSRVIKVDVVHSEIRDRTWPEIRIDNCSTVGALKEKLYSHCGTSPGMMVLYAYDPMNVDRTQILLDNDSLQLHMYGINDGYTVYISVKEDKNAARDVNVKSKYSAMAANLSKSPLKHTNSKLHSHYMEQLEKCAAANDEAMFQHYRMSDEDYEERGKGLRNFIALMREKAGVVPPQMEQHQEAKTMEELKKLFPIDARCCVRSSDVRGAIKFVGVINNKPMIGVDLDEPLGSCDGSLGVVRYFTAKGGKYGAFYSYGDVMVGDYPELDPFDIE